MEESLEGVETLNKTLGKMDPWQIIAWAKTNFPAGLFQTTAFGPTGIAIIHMLNQTKDRIVPLLFIDTLHRITPNTDRRFQRNFGAGAHGGGNLPHPGQDILSSLWNHGGIHSTKRR
jgi:3'-phosphoadenosine 5'-phosphosulfate sulfotransferase (PAPS reductase)/FAD synthetase